MKFFIMMFLFDLLIPIIMLMSGYWMTKFPPKNINSWMGYRTSMSKKNQDTWDFAHNYCGKLWIKAGWIVLIISIIAFIPIIHANENTIGIMSIVMEVIQIIVLLATIIPVEKALRDTFDEHGRRK